MRSFKVGDRLALATRHQDTRRFAPINTIGVVQAISEGHTEKMKVRVYRPDWRPKQGYLHEFLRVSDTIWMERIGIRKEKDGRTNLPSVHEILSELSEEKFEKRHAALIEAADAS